MELFRLLQSHERRSFLLFLLGLIHDAACDDWTSNSSWDQQLLWDRQLQTIATSVTLEPRPNNPPTCPDPVTEQEDSGYEPKCPPGYFRCCATCKGAVCYSETDLVRSWRGIKECKLCAAGDYCEGCDTYEMCRESDVPGREGYKTSPPGSKRPQDCQICPTGQEAHLDRLRCMNKWTDACNEKWVKRCVRNCRAEDPIRGKNMTFCERMKCELFCAKRWSSDCVSAFKTECEFLKAGPNPVDTYPDYQEWLNNGCDVDCSGALQHHLGLIALLGTVFRVLYVSL